MNMSLLSVNEVGLNSTGWQGAKYRRYRDKFTSALRAHVVPKATGKRRLTIVRQYGRGKRAYDHINFACGCKALLDVIVRMGWLIDDKPAYVDDWYTQERSPDRKDHAIIVIEEVEDA